MNNDSFCGEFPILLMNLRLLFKNLLINKLAPLHLSLMGGRGDINICLNVNPLSAWLLFSR